MCHACDWKRVFFRRGICKYCCDVFITLLHRFLPPPFLPGDLPMLSSLPTPFLSEYWSVSHASSKLAGHWKGLRANQQALPLKKQYIKTQQP